MKKLNIKSENLINPDSSVLFENLISKKTLAQKLECSVSYVNKLMKQKIIPYIKAGRAVRFKYSEVVATLQKRSIA